LLSFTSPLFFLALALAAVGLYTIPGRWRAAYGLLLSYGFYAMVSLKFLGLMVAASLLAYAIGLGIARASDERAKLRLMLLGIGGLLAGIVAFKAGGAWHGWLLPLGLSYYSFKLMSYVIEVYWDEDSVERDLTLFLGYPAFFPQIISGPIQRSAPYFAQMRALAGRRLDEAQIEQGFGLIVTGLMLKLLIGDRLFTLIAAVDAAPGSFTRAGLLATVAGYTLQLYADFAGYTRIALGIGKMLGIDGPPNFNAPFLATNIQEMWRRWHMSLTTWLTDYLFIPLTMTLRGFGLAGLLLCILINMVLIGVWHGFTLNYLIFGVMHAVYFSLTLLWFRYVAPPRGRKAPPEPRLQRLAKTGLGMLLTFALMSSTQIFFHSGTFAQAWGIVRQILGVLPSGTRAIGEIAPGASATFAACALIAAWAGCGAPGASGLSARIAPLVPRWLQYGIGLFLLAILTPDSAGSFVYGQF